MLNYHYNCQKERSIIHINTSKGDLFVIKARENVREKSEVKYNVFKRH